MKPIIHEHGILVPIVFALPVPVTSDLNYAHNFRSGKSMDSITDARQTMRSSSCFDQSLVKATSGFDDRLTALCRESCVCLLREFISIFTMFIPLCRMHYSFLNCFLENISTIAGK